MCSSMRALVCVHTYMHACGSWCTVHAYMHACARVHNYLCFERMISSSRSCVSIHVFYYSCMSVCLFVCVCIFHVRLVSMSMCFVCKCACFRQYILMDVCIGLCVCIHMRVCECSSLSAVSCSFKCNIRIYLCTNERTSVHVCVACVRASVRACVRACLQTYLRTCMYACARVYIRACLCACLHACMHACFLACLHACIHKMHSCINAFILICMHVWKSSVKFFIWSRTLFPNECALAFLTYSVSLRICLNKTLCARLTVETKWASEALRLHFRGPVVLKRPGVCLFILCQVYHFSCLSYLFFLSRLFDRRLLILQYCWLGRKR